LPEGLLTDVLVDGLLAGVAGTLVFIPQIAILFLGIALLEDSGYLARTAFLVDKLMSKAGLPGKAFVPLLSSFACNVPGIMATRTIASRSERLVTILIAPLVTCAARLPVYTMVTAAVFAGSAPVLGFLSLGGLVITAMYLFGFVLALLAAFAFRRTFARGASSPLMLEMPPYRVPQPLTIATVVLRRIRHFTVHTGSVIVALTIILWALMTFPRTALNPVEQARVHAESSAASAPNKADDNPKTRMERYAQRKQLERSYAGQLGKLIEPVIAPLGFDWRLGIGLIGSLAAREVLIPVMGQVYGRGGDLGDEDQQRVVGHSMVRFSGMTPLIGLSLMVFFAVAMQCLSTVAVIRDETKSWKWPLFALGYLNVLAWLLSLFVYQVGSALGYA
jgi:ferrous iron transport protein B